MGGVQFDEAGAANRVGDRAAGGRRRGRVVPADDDERARMNVTSPR
jgi:hypothetical protein